MSKLVESLLTMQVEQLKMGKCEITEISLHK
jgi:hypothetical protein